MDQFINLYLLFLTLSMKMYSTKNSKNKNRLFDIILIDRSLHLFFALRPCGGPVSTMSFLHNYKLF